MLDTACASSASICFDGLTLLRADAVNGRPGRLKRTEAYAEALGWHGIQPNAANDLWDSAAGGGSDPENAEWWGTGPSAIRASLLLERRCEWSYRAGLLGFARARLTERVTRKGRPLAEYDLEQQVIRTAQDADLPAADIVDLVAEYADSQLSIEHRRDLIDLAEREVRGFHHCQATISVERSDMIAEARAQAALALDQASHESGVDNLVVSLRRWEPDLSEEDAADVVIDFLRDASASGNEAASKILRQERVHDHREFLSAMEAAMAGGAILHSKTIALVERSRRFVLTAPRPAPPAPLAVICPDEEPADHGDAQPTAPAPFIEVPKVGGGIHLYALASDEPHALTNDDEDAEPAKPIEPMAGLVNPPGLVGEIMDWMEASSDRPCRPLLLGPALTLVATLVGQKFASPTDLRTNNYIVTLAPSGHGKDHGLQQVKRLVDAAKLDRYVGPARIMSASALRRLVGREPSIGCFMDEFGGFMSQIHDRRAGLHNTMIRNDMLEFFSAAGTFFSGAEYAAEPATKIHSPNFSINGTSTPAQFWNSLSSMSGEDGLLARMILINVDGPKPEYREPLVTRQDVPQSLVKALHALAEAHAPGNMVRAQGGSFRPYTVPYDAAAAALVRALGAEIDDRQASSSLEEHPYLNRTKEHAIKLALTVAVGVDPRHPIISGEIMDWASRLARSSTQMMIRESVERIADNERGAAVNRMLRIIRDAGTKGVTEGRIFDRMRGVDKRTREQILADLRMAGKIRLERKASTGGRCSERYVAV